jgi:hypothetical protein
VPCPARLAINCKCYSCCDITLKDCFAKLLHNTSGSCASLLVRLERAVLSGGLTLLKLLTRNRFLLARAFTPLVLALRPCDAQIKNSTTNCSRNSSRAHSQQALGGKIVFKKHDQHAPKHSKAS